MLQEECAISTYMSFYSGDSKLLCSVCFLSALTYSFCKTGADKDITITALLPTSNK